MSLLVCNGMNRSGSTLQYNMARLLLERRGMGVGEGAVNAAELARSPQYAAWLAAPQWHIVKTHQLLPDAPRELTAGRMAVCYIYRDLREVAGSYKRVWGVAGEPLLRELDEAVQTYEAVQQLPGRVLQQRYETATADLPQAVREMAAWLGLAVTAEEVAEVAAACSAETMQHVQQRLARRLHGRRLVNRLLRPVRRLLRKLGLQRAGRGTPGAVVRKQAMDEQTLLHPEHVGAPGASIARLTPAEFDLITARYRFWLQRAGYLTEGRA